MDYERIILQREQQLGATRELQERVDVLQEQVHALQSLLAETIGVLRACAYSQEPILIERLSEQARSIVRAWPRPQEPDLPLL